jgi:hypothetical protein
MNTTKSRNQPSLRFLVIFSVVALCCTILIIIYPPTAGTEVYLQKLLIGTIFATICVGGGVASLFPEKCVSTSEAHAFEPDSSPRNKRHLTIRGHHPDCGRFSTHTVQLGGTVHCAACTGLFAGTLIALTGTALYFFLGFNPEAVSLPLIVFGLASIVIGLLQYNLRSWLRVSANVLFVLGGSFVMIGADEYVHSLSVDLFVLGAILLWIFTRIAVSQWDHSRICRSCGFSCVTERKER